MATLHLGHISAFLPPPVPACSCSAWIARLHGPQSWEVSSGHSQSASLGVLRNREAARAQTRHSQRDHEEPQRSECLLTIFCWQSQ